jgi:flavorubredoxin
MPGDSPQPLPRELAPGLFWLGDCQQVRTETEILHSYNSLYLVRGQESSVLIEAGFPEDYDMVQEQLDGLLESGPPLRHLWITHQETPHAGGVGRLLDRFPELEVRGDIHDYHLFFPAFADRFRPLELGGSIDLGGRSLVAVSAAIRDLITTQWAFDTGSGALFPGDGFAYAHHHKAGECGKVVSEVPGLDVAFQSALFAEYALHWMKFVEMQPFADRLQAMLSELDVRVVCPTHGLPVIDVPAVMPEIVAGLLEV